jgi:uncharacterized membrane protein
VWWYRRIFMEGQKIMNFDISTSHPFIIILIMAIITLMTRWGGVYIMNYIPISDGTQRFITAMSSSVLVAILAPIAFDGDTAARLALLMTAIVMLIFKKPLLAISMGLLSAALCRYYLL